MAFGKADPFMFLLSKAGTEKTVIFDQVPTGRALSFLGNFFETSAAGIPKARQKNKIK